MPDVFERHEKKYLLNAEQRAWIEEALLHYMEADAFGKSTIRNIYYDTPDFRLIRHSLEKPVYKEKLRIRSYRKVSGEDEVFVELKKKYKGIVYKRRIAMPENKAMRYLAGDADCRPDSQIGREIDYFCRLYGRPEPKVYLNYDRTAYFGKEDPGLRISFDQKIQWRTTGLRLTEEPGGREILAQGRSLMEIKAGGAMPVWLTALMSEAKIRPVSISKYGTAYQTMLAEGSVAFLKTICLEKNDGRNRMIRKNEGIAYA